MSLHLQLPPGTMEIPIMGSVHTINLQAVINTHVMAIKGHTAHNTQPNPTRERIMFLTAPAILNRTRTHTDIKANLHNNFHTNLLHQYPSVSLKAITILTRTKTHTDIKASLHNDIRTNLLCHQALTIHQITPSKM